MVEAFRRAESPMEKASFRLRGLDATAEYAVTNIDAPGEKRFSGRALMEQGLPVEIAAQSGAAVYIYREVRAAR